MTLLLDTCALIFAVMEPHRLTLATRQALEAEDNVVLVSAVSVGEIACSVQRGRLTLNSPWAEWFTHHVQLNGWTVLPITQETMVEAYSLPGEFRNDPVDRLIVAQARLGQHKVVTSDGRIRKYPHVASIE